MSKYKANSVFESMGFALRGIFITLKSQLNFRIEVIIAIMGFILAMYLRFTYVELAIFVFTVALMLFAEMMNTVNEFIIDAYFGNKYSMLAKMGKDICAGAVFLTSFLSVIIGVLLFAPKIYSLLIFKLR